MAIDYDILFDDINTFIRAIEHVREMTTGQNMPKPNLLQLERDTQDALTVVDQPADPPPQVLEGRFNILSGMDLEYIGFKDQATVWTDTLGGRVDSRLQDRETIIPNLPGLGDGVTLDRVLRELYNDMENYIDPVSMTLAQKLVRESTVTIGSPTLTATSQGNGTVFLTKRLDGSSSPRSGAPRQVTYNGKNSQLVVPSESLVWTCSNDSFGGGTEGAEAFRLESEPQEGTGYDWRPEKSGESVNVTAINTSTLQRLQNADFESWVNVSTPAAWTVESGGVSQNTSEFFRGASSVEVVGGAKITQPIVNLLPRTMYAATFAYRAISGSVTFIMKMEGTMDGAPYVPAGEELLQVTTSDTNWNQGAIFFLTSDQPGNDFKLSIEANANSHIDSASFSAVTYVAGVGSVLVAGSSPWTVGDRLSVPLSNADEGIIQRFWRRRYNRQLPSSIATWTITEPVL